VIDFLIVHEPPVIELLPAADAEKWRTFHYNIYMKNLSEGWEPALVDFSASLIGAPDIPFPPDLDERVSGNMDFFSDMNTRPSTSIYQTLSESEKIRSIWWLL
jgi:hypothetical protein